MDLLKNLDSKSDSSDTYMDSVERDSALLTLLSQTQIMPSPDLNKPSSPSHDSITDRYVVSK